MKKAIILGASSGIGRSLAQTLAKKGYALGLAARRLPLLLELQREINTPVLVQEVDIANTQNAILQLSELIRAMNDIDLFVISAGTGFINPELDLEKEIKTIAVNVTGFTTAVNVAMDHFLQKGKGHLANISSIAALRGNGNAPAYSASKAYESNYLDGMRQKIARLRLPITITDIQPGFVDTDMAQGEGLFWVASPAKAAQQIFQAIRAKRKHAYITKRWRLMAWFFKFAPDIIYDRL